MSCGLPFPAATSGRAAAPFTRSSSGPSPATSIHQKRGAQSIGASFLFHQGFRCLISQDKKSLKGLDSCMNSRFMVDLGAVGC